MSLRQDQLRDKDAIRRDMLGLEIDGDRVEVGCHANKVDQIVVNFYEPTESKNVGNTKLQLRFNNPCEATRFFEKCVRVLRAFQDRGALTSEDLEAIYQGERH